MTYNAKLDKYTVTEHDYTVFQTEAELLAYFEYENMDDFNNDDNEYTPFEITCGTYNGATQIFTPWDINNKNIEATIYQELSDTDFYDTYAEVIDSNKFGDYLNEFLFVHNVYAVKETGKVYRVER